MGALEQMDGDVVDLTELRRNLELAASMLDAMYTDETRWIQTHCQKIFSAYRFFFFCSLFTFLFILPFMLRSLK